MILVRVSCLSRTVDGIPVSRGGDVCRVHHIIYVKEMCTGKKMALSQQHADRHDYLYSKNVRDPTNRSSLSL